MFAAIGYNWGGSGANFNVPLLNNGRFLRGVGGNAGTLGTYQTDQLGTHTHSVVDPGHLHDLTFSIPGGPGPYFIGGPGASVVQTNAIATNTTGITIAATGGNETRPANAAVNYIIKT